MELRCGNLSSGPSEETPLLWDGWEGYEEVVVILVQLLSVYSRPSSFYFFSGCIVWLVRS